MWYQWDDSESFNQWHHQICLLLGIPNEQTLAYTNPLEIEGKVIAVVHNEEAEGLVPTNLRPPEKIIQ